MADEKRIIDGYEVTHAIQLSGSEVIFAVHPTEAAPYMVCDATRNNAFGIEEYTNALAGDDPVEMLRLFTDRISERMASIEKERTERGIPFETLSAKDCIPKSADMDYTDKVVVINANRLAPEYASIDYQIVLCTHGNGARPHAIGRSVFCETLYDGAKSRWDRTAIAGIILPERMPEWAHEKLAAIQKPAEQESVIDKIRQSKEKDTEPKPKTKKHDKSGPEL